MVRRMAPTAAVSIITHDIDTAADLSVGFWINRPSLNSVLCDRVTGARRSGGDGRCAES
jgi:hypothetical protein